MSPDDGLAAARAAARVAARLAPGGDGGSGAPSASARAGGAHAGGPSAAAVVALEQVSLWRTFHGQRRLILDRIEWTALAGEHWGIVGPNGAGKTSLLRIASAQARPSDGTAWVLGERLGRVPLQVLRRRIGLVEPSLGRRFYPAQRAIDVVCSGFSGSILLPAALSAADLERARRALDEAGAGSLADRLFSSCSEGERARIMLARALVADAQLLALDEPAGGLDLGGRELLLGAFESALSDRPELTTLTVTHHIEELPPSTTHALLLRAGRVLAAGPIDATLTDESLSECFGLPIRLERTRGRLFPHARY